MHGPVGNLLESTVNQEHVLEREFEKNLPDLARLAFRVAYSVLRQREDAEDVAQEGLVRAYRRLRSLREHDRLRS
jgi:DNA-directed RNA polymerase specialized sigma24 family protein